MRARDVMTRDVVTVGPATPVRDIAAAMVEHRVSAVPVVDHGRVIGIVTDGDLYRRAELGTEKRANSFFELLFKRHPGATAYVEAHGRTARDVMTSDVTAVSPGTTLLQIADLFEAKKLRRVPVIADEGLVGIVSRADLVRALASMPPSSPETELADRQIHDLVMAEFKRLPWGLKSEDSVLVDNGVVHLWGFVPSDEEREALRIAALAVPGVTKVVDHTIRFAGDVPGRPAAPSTLTVIGPECGLAANV